MMTSGASPGMAASAATGSTNARAATPPLASARATSGSSSTIKTGRGGSIYAEHTAAPRPSGRRPRSARAPRRRSEARQELVVRVELGELLQEALHRLDGL